MNDERKRVEKRYAQNLRIRNTDCPFLWAISSSWCDDSLDISVHTVKEGSDYFEFLANQLRESGQNGSTARWLYLANESFEVVEPVVPQAGQRVWSAVLEISGRHSTKRARAIIVVETEKDLQSLVSRKTVTVYRAPKNCSLVALYYEKLLRT